MRERLGQADHVFLCSEGKGAFLMLQTGDLRQGGSCPCSNQAFIKRVCVSASEAGLSFYHVEALHSGTRMTNHFMVGDKNSLSVGRSIDDSALVCQA